MRGILVSIFLFAMAPPGVAAATSPVEVGELRVDHAVEPLGIEDPNPVLGWQLRSDRRGERQTAYRVQVAASAAELESGPYLWDSGRVESAESVAVPYDDEAGATLESGQRYLWRVRVWDGDGESSAWSEPGSWEMALLEDADWQGAEWIAPQGPTEAVRWSDYELDVDFSIASGAAGFVFRALDRDNFYMWQIGIDGGRAQFRPHARVGGQWVYLEDGFDVSFAIPEGELHDLHHLKIRAEGDRLETWIDGILVDVRRHRALAIGGVGFRSGGVGEDAGFDNLEVRDLGGQTLFADDFSAGTDPAFPGAEIEAGALRSRAGRLDLIASTPSVPLLRREFTLERPVAEVASARAYVYGLGLYDLRLSGASIEDRELTPPATPYAQSLRYQTYDVTGSLREGANVVGVELAEGFGPRFSRHGWRWLGPRQARLLLDVRFADGAHQRVVTDSSWHSGEGPILDASIYGGETFDARLDSGWDEPGFDASGWGSVRNVSPPAGGLTADTASPVRAVATLAPRDVAEPSPGVYVFDFGRNVAGWVRLRVAGPAGTVVRLRHAENIAADGSLDPFTNRNAAATDTYVLGGGVEEVYEPTFTYHGFRYVEVTGLPAAPDGETVAARVVHSALPATAEFSSSNPLLDRIYANNRHGMANNAIGAPTDTPTRDERTHPGLDVQAYEAALVRDFDADRYLDSYLREIDGWWGGSPDMNAAHIPVAWSLYEQYGDREALARTYPEMTAALDRYESEASGLIWPEPAPETVNGFGDWCPPVPLSEAAGGLGGPEVGGYPACFSEVSLVNTALAFRAARIVAAAARALGEDADAAHYDDLAGRIAAAFDAQFADGEGRYGSGRQVTSVLPLAFGMVSGADRDAAAAAFVARVLGTDGGHLDTGIFGTRFLLDALVAAGRPDVALTVLGQETYPGFGFQIAQGATTPWEQWIRRSSMITHDHAMFAGINASFITRFAGIEPMAPGYAQIRVAPVVPVGLEHAAATLRTVRGTVSSDWQREGDELTLAVTVPANAVADVRVPVAEDDEVRESGMPAAQSPGVERLEAGDDFAEFRVGAGEYRFVAAPEEAEGEDPGSEEPEVTTGSDSGHRGPPQFARHRPECRGRPATIVGTAGADFLRGTRKADVIVAFGGRDRIRSYAGDDLICAGAGDDLIRAGGGDDLVLGQRGRDRLLGGPGRDRLLGGPGGPDFCDGGRGPDRRAAPGCERRRGMP